MLTTDGDDKSMTAVLVPCGTDPAKEVETAQDVIRTPNAVGYFLVRSNKEVANALAAINSPRVKVIPHSLDGRKRALMLGYEVSSEPFLLLGHSAMRFEDHWLSHAQTKLEQQSKPVARLNDRLGRDVRLVRRDAYDGNTDSLPASIFVNDAIIK